MLYVSACILLLLLAFNKKACLLVLFQAELWLCSLKDHDALFLKPIFCDWLESC